MRIVLADDSVLLREGLELILTDAGHRVVGRAADGPSAIATVLAERPDLAILDVRMPPSHRDEGMRAAAAIRAQWAAAPLLILSQYVERSYARDLVGPAFGYLLKDRVSDIPAFLTAVQTVATGGTVIDPQVVAQFLASPAASPVDALTPREREVLGLMAQGLGNAAIAARLVLTEGAIEKHTQRIFAKLALDPGSDQHRRVVAVLAYLDQG
ncbi:MAG: response regulator transcription factor [Austwickia sp.]|nr:response regulator transcription factor [Actinomycetota bacterium]MCB1254720.1 response regulator transcription factor [Austwickia sp.]MCO5309672.1 response regulator transcription factor [Austwickia sp.]